MNIIEPQNDMFTIYSKSGCVNCTKVKSLLKENKASFVIVDCDEYILENKEEFLGFIEKNVGKEYKIFPMVFNDKKFIGGFKETEEYLSKMLDFDNSF